MKASRLQPERRCQAGEGRDVPGLEGRARESGAQDGGAGGDSRQNPLPVGEGDPVRLGHEDRQLRRLENVRVEGDVRARDTLECPSDALLTEVDAVRADELHLRRIEVARTDEYDIVCFDRS